MNSGERFFLKLIGDGEERLWRFVNDWVGRKLECFADSDPFMVSRNS